MTARGVKRNNRLFLILDGSSGNVLERNTYTPMGWKWTARGSGAGITLTTNRYRYNGKEEHELAAGMPYTDGYGGYPPRA